VPAERISWRFDVTIPRERDALNPGAAMPTPTELTTDALGTAVIDETLLTFRRQKELAERALAQVGDRDFFRTIDAESNSLAILVQHVGGNLKSRWTDFLTTDGEKPDRNRDGEFIVGDDARNRSRVMSVWELGWATLFQTLASLRAADLTATVHIRGESLTAIGAIQRSLAHVAQHVGQVVLLAKHYRSTDWKTLSIPRGQSQDWHPSSAPR
jgi:hypothetical protein